MKFIYTPQGAEPITFDYKPGRLLSPEAEKIEELTGWTYMEFGEHLMSQSMKAFHALLYIFLKRSNPTLKYEQVVFAFDEVDIDYDDSEIGDMIEGLLERKAEQGLDPETETYLQMLIEKVDWKPATEPEVEVDPKASEAFAQPGSGSSLTSSTSAQETSPASQSTS